jgi:D-alanyl-D-alanine carboxypeptidase
VFRLAPGEEIAFFRRMGSSRFLISVLSCSVALLLGSGAYAATPKKKKAKDDAPVVQAAKAYKGAIVIDAATGNTLFEDNPDIENPPASVTKLMTFAVVSDRIKAGALALDTPVTVGADEAKMGGTQVFLKEKEVFPVEELLYAMMIQSANDAAAALARVSAGSRPAFVELMNAKAKELGMSKTTFRSPHGLPPSDRKLSDSDITTPRDLALLSRYLVLQTDVLKYSSTKNRKFGEGRRAEPMDMKNHNNLLGKVAGVDGLKTGFTNGAAFCLAATAERNGRRLIAVVMGSPDAKTRDLKAAELIEKGFAALPLPATPPSPISPISAPPPTTTKSAPTRPSSASISPVQAVEPESPKSQETAPIKYPSSSKRS